MCPVDHVPSGERGSPSGKPSHGPGLGDFQIQLLSSMMAQTEALNRLARSNEGLTQTVAMLIEQMAADEGVDGLPATYMDGSPVR